MKIVIMLVEKKWKRVKIMDEIDKVKNLE